MRYKILEIRTYKNRWEVDVLYTKRQVWLFGEQHEEKRTYFHERYGDSKLYPDRFFWTDTYGNSLTSIDYDGGLDGHILTMAVFNKNSRDRYEILVEETNDKVE